MSEMLTRLERKPLITKGIAVTVDSSKEQVVFEKDKKTLKVTFDANLIMPAVENDRLVVKTHGNSREHAQRLGTFLSLANAAIIGVTTGFKQDFEIKGTGYKVASQSVDGKTVLVFQLGYSNESASTYVLPENVVAKITTPTQFSLESIDKQALGQVSSDVRLLRKVNPYKGKGVLLKGQVLILKETKKKK